MIPAAICMVAPIAQQRLISTAVPACAVSSSTILKTDTTAAVAARKVPAALSSSTASAIHQAKNEISVNVDTALSAQKDSAISTVLSIFGI